MTFRKITLRKENGTTLEFRPENIQAIIFDKDIIILHYLQERVFSLSATTEIILKKEDYYYPHWEYFILQITRIFEIER